MKPLYSRTPVQPRKILTTMKIILILLVMPLPTTQAHTNSTTTPATLLIIHSHQATTPTRGKTRVDLIISQNQMGMIHPSQPFLHLMINLIKNSQFLSSQL